MNKVDKIIRLSDNFIKKVAQNIGSKSPAFKMLLIIDNSPGHYMAVDDMTEAQLKVSEILAKNRLVDLIPANHAAITDSSGYNRRHVPTDKKLPARYVLTSNGSYAIKTFEFDTLRDEL